MNDRIRLALDSDRLVDITTTGRKTGKQHRIELGLSHLEGSHLFQVEVLESSAPA